MRSAVMAVMLLAVLATGARADSYNVTVSAAGEAEYSDAIPVSGYLERVEIYKSSDNNVVDIDLATFQGTTAMNTFVDLTLGPGTNRVVFPRYLPTDNTGTALAPSYAVGAGTNGVVQALQVAYDKHMVGGNLKLKVGASSGTNATVNCVIYYTRLPR